MSMMEETNAEVLLSPVRSVSRVHPVSRANENLLLSTRSGGSQADFEDLPGDLLAESTQLFERECARRGTPVRLRGGGEPLITLQGDGGLQ